MIGGMGSGRVGLHLLARARLLGGRVADRDEVGGAGQRVEAAALERGRQLAAEGDGLCDKGLGEARAVQDPLRQVVGEVVHPKVHPHLVRLVDPLRVRNGVADPQPCARIRECTVYTYAAMMVCDAMTYRPNRKPWTES